MCALKMKQLASGVRLNQTNMFPFITIITFSLYVRVGCTPCSEPSMSQQAKHFDQTAYSSAGVGMHPREKLGV